jgi:hypothetical protein
MNVNSNKIYIVCIYSLAKVSEINNREIKQALDQNNE